ncbi:LysM peptidoglycan-binding domain-containing protein [Chloroflexus sp.]|uniref:LysM peptidoglycan-binding domain-containing protein n=1 Tax=Chloroflexus sp. TaxID=1904827 RepID=UPI002ADD95C2|nr:LysM peptidoglycan-binding domain-containing protein [Chloroflexus sp.]
MLTETTLWLLLLFILLAPPVGALVLRMVQHLIGSIGIAAGMTTVLVLAAVALLTIARNPLPPLRIGDLTILPAWAPPVVDTMSEEPLPVVPTLPVLPTLTPRPTVTITATATPQPSPTPEPRPTVEPTPEPTPTLAPTASGPQRYTVQAGDTLRTIAERFGVTIEALLQANNLTPAQGDNLQVGQELVIP